MLCEKDTKSVSENLLSDGVNVDRVSQKSPSYPRSQSHPTIGVERASSTPNVHVPWFVHGQLLFGPQLATHVGMPSHILLKKGHRLNRYQDREASTHGRPGPRRPQSTA